MQIPLKKDRKRKSGSTNTKRNGKMSKKRNLTGINFGCYIKNKGIKKEGDELVKKNPFYGEPVSILQ
jgi:hypothetical protein